MTVIVEFFGIPRQRAGVASVEVGGDSLRAVLHELAARFPRFATDCLRDGGLAPVCIACINGGRFTSDADMRLEDGDVLMLLSADAGG